VSRFAVWFIATVSVVTGIAVSLAAFELSFGMLIWVAASLLLALAIDAVLRVVFLVANALVLVVPEAVREYPSIAGRRATLQAGQYSLAGAALLVGMAGVLGLALDANPVAVVPLVPAGWCLLLGMGLVLRAYRNGEVR
jgi:hypothetical protein